MIEYEDLSIFFSLVIKDIHLQQFVLMTLDMFLDEDEFKHPLTFKSFKVLSKILLLKSK